MADYSLKHISERTIEVINNVIKKGFQSILLVGPQSKRWALPLSQYVIQKTLCKNSGCNECAICKSIINQRNPDVLIKSFTSRALTVAEARTIVQVSRLAPQLSMRRIIVIPELHLADEAVAVLLKTIEEPPPSASFILIADRITARLITLASRSQVIHINAFAFESEVSQDEQEFWKSIKNRLEPAGYTIANLINEIKDFINSSQNELKKSQVSEKQSLAKIYQRDPDSCAKVMADLEQYHQKELRHNRISLISRGLLILAELYLNEIKTSFEKGSHHVYLSENRISLDKATYLTEISKEFVRNPNEDALIQAALIKLAGYKTG
jgi:DNA polymerase III delta prime subunit